MSETMASATSTATLWTGAAALVALAALQILWHAWLQPPSAHLAATLAIAVVPLLPAIWTCGRRLRRGVLLGGIVCLFYFCHGVSVAYADADARAPACVEIALTLIVIGALGWDARHYRRKPKQLA